MEAMLRAARGRLWKGWRDAGGRSFSGLWEGWRDTGETEPQPCSAAAFPGSKLTLKREEALRNISETEQLHGIRLI